MKFSETQSARPSLIHRSRSRDSACVMNFSASATVGADAEDAPPEEAFALEAVPFPCAEDAIAKATARNAPSTPVREAISFVMLAPWLSAFEDRSEFIRIA